MAEEEVEYRVVFTAGRRGKAPLFEVVNDSEELTEQLQIAEDNEASILNRSLRDSLLSESDWTQGADSPLTTEKKTEWATYRGLLRDLPDHEDWPHLEDEDWPTKPT